jgi:predicted TIM-barrel fold metal-dependent hydrolase
MNLIANVHCHFMNSSHVPQSYFDAKSIFGELEVGVTKSRDFLDVKNFWFKNRTIDNYITLGQFKYSNIKGEDTIKFAGPQNTGYQIITPLMMNMVAACNTTRISSDNYEYNDPLFNAGSKGGADGVSPFRIQVQEYSLLAALYPNRVFPFVVFNPLVDGNLGMCKNAVKDLGFIGIKMYPSHGYSPDPFDYLLDKSKMPVDLAIADPVFFNIYGQRLIEFYKWANELDLPITVHCRYLSMQKTIDLDDQAMIAFNNPRGWERVLNAYTQIRVNFAHFGGDNYALSCTCQNSFGCFCEHGCDHIEAGPDGLPYCTKIRAEIKKPDRDLSYTWLQTIIKLAEANPGRIFSDIAANYFALDDTFGHPFSRQNDRERYVNHIYTILQEVKKGNLAVQLMFGTDTPVKTIENVSDKQFLENYAKIINPQLYPEFYWDTAIKFLFGKDRVIPEMYRKFLSQADDIYCIRRDDGTRSRDANQLRLISNDNGHTVRRNLKD